MLISIIKTERDNVKYITMQEEILSGLSSYSPQTATYLV